MLRALRSFAPPDSRGRLSIRESRLPQPPEDVRTPPYGLYFASQAAISRNTSWRCSQTLGKCGDPG